MEVELNAHEARVLGVLIEKAFTTPEQYPLSLNATTNGCNQKSNRHPVVDFSEAEVTVALTGLQMKQLAGAVVGSRVEKWRHTAKEHLSVGEPDLAVLAELLMRGPQAPGELRTRASRMRNLANLEELSHALNRLVEKGHVKRLPPAPGSRAERWVQLLAPNLHLDDEPEAPTSTSRAPAPARTSGLEERVARLERQLAELAEKLGETLHD